MKIAILATSIACLVAIRALADPIPDGLEIHATSGSINPALTLSTSGGDSVTIRYTIDNSGASPVNITSFDSVTHSAQWQWRTVPAENASGDSTVSMWLDSAAILGLNDPASGDVRLKLSADRSITFLPITGETGDLVLHRSGATLNIGSYPILTTSSGDSRYIVAVPNRFQYGPGAHADTDFAFAFGDTAQAYGLGAIAMGATYRNGGITLSTSASGNGAVSLGYANRATGDGAVAIGSTNASTAAGAVGIGGGNAAGGQYSLAFGSINFIDTAATYSVAGGYHNTVHSAWAAALGYENQLGPWATASMAVGFSNNVLSDISFAAGSTNLVDGQSGIAFGNSNASHGLSSVTMGTQCTTTGAYSLAIGHWNTVESTGNSASALGIGTTAKGTSQFVVGSYNAPITDQSTLVRSDVDAAFIIGNGYQTTGELDVNGNPKPQNIGNYVANPDANHVVRRNALVVHWNGNVEAGGGVSTSEGGGVSVPNTLKAAAGKVLVPLQGDISMGEFGGGEQP